jgi:thioredoxin reductase/bacterioferritin-associated ferredoxin
MVQVCDVTVLGAGPAGASAAVEVARLGLSVSLVDEADAAGGQVYRVAMGVDVPAREPERVAGDALRAALAASAVGSHFGCRVWHVERSVEGYDVRAQGDTGTIALRSRALIVATGAQEKHLPVQGWESPGVIGLAAATVLLKAQRVLPGREVIVAGAGPLLLAVAAGIIKSGGRVAAIVDVNPRRAWLRNARALASRPDLAARGARWMALLAARGVPMLHRSVVTRVEHGAEGLRVTVASPEAERTIASDALCLGYGLTPATEITRALGAMHAYDPASGGWHVMVDDAQRTSLAGLFACGDATGITGAAAAPWSGRLAALGAAVQLGHRSSADVAAALRTMTRQRDRAARFGRAMTALTAVDNVVLPVIAPDTIVCLCEGVSRRVLDDAIDDGARTLGELKTATRCGMGPCGGRVCGEAAAGLLALRIGASRADVGCGSVRSPLRPVALGVLAAEGRPLGAGVSAPA